MLFIAYGSLGMRESGKDTLCHVSPKYVIRQPVLCRADSEVMEGEENGAESRKTLFGRIPVEISQGR